MSTSHPVRASHTCTLARVNLGAEEFTKHVCSLCFILFVGRVQVIPATPSLRWWSPQLSFSGWHDSFPFASWPSAESAESVESIARPVTSVARSDESRRALDHSHVGHSDTAMLIHVSNCSDDAQRSSQKITPPPESALTIVCIGFHPPKCFNYRICRGYYWFFKDQE